MRRFLLMAGCLLGLGLASCQSDHLVDAPPVMVLGVESLDFGAVAVGRTVWREVRVRNLGASALVLGEATFPDDTDSSFSASVPATGIAPADEAMLTVRFMPKNVQDYQVTMVVHGNDPDRPTAEILLRGEGFRQGALEVEPRQVDFGTINAGQAGLEQVFIRNVGNGELLVTAITLSPETSGDFHILSSTQSGLLSSGSEVPVRLAYRPGIDSLPPSDGLLIIEAADPFLPRVEVVLTAALNRAPIADAGPDQDVDPLDEPVLDGTKSYDPDEQEPLTYSWSLSRKPVGSETVLFDELEAQPSLIPDLVGIYEVELFVTDTTGLTSLLPDRVAIAAIPAERVLLELVWDSPVADLDLHLIASGGTFGGLLDCFYGNRDPDWGEKNNLADDPQLKRDDLVGFGPEIIGYNEPVDGSYTLVVDYFASHTPSGQEPTTATLRVFADGLLEAEIVRRLEAQGQRWQVASIAWPEGTVLAIDELD